MKYSVRCWPFGEGETDNNTVGDPEYFDSLELAMLRSIKELAEWLDATIDPYNGDAPDEYVREIAMKVTNEIVTACESTNPPSHDEWKWTLYGPMYNDCVVIEAKK